MIFASKYKDKYSFVVDPDPFPGIPWQPGDATWQSAWLYFAYCVLGKNEWKWLHVCHEWDTDPIRTVEFFLANFYEHCCKHDRMITHPDKPDHWSQDQAWTMLLLLAAACKYQPHLFGLAKKIVEHFIHLDRNHNGWMNPDVGNKGNLEDNMRFVLCQLAKSYNLPYPEYGQKNMSMLLCAYEGIYKGDSYLGMIPKKAKPPSYTIWNNLGGMVAAAICNSSCRGLGSYFTWFSQNGWGSAYDIVSGRSVGAIDWYKDKKTQFIDIIQQRGKNHILGDRPALDYPITLAIQEVWNSF